MAGMMAHTLAAALVLACVLALSDLAAARPVDSVSDTRQPIVKNRMSEEYGRIGSHFRSHFEKNVVLSDPDKHDVVVFWSINSHRSEIELGVVARGKGYVALGLNSKLSMKGLDVAVVSLDSPSGEFRVDDYFATDFAQLILDPGHLQNWQLQEAQRNGTHTAARLLRPLVTCDEEHDVDIGQAPMTVAYALGGAGDELTYHVARGGKTVSFFLDELIEEPPAVPGSLIFNASTWPAHSELMARPTTPDKYAVDLFSLEEYPEYTVPNSQASTYTCFKFNITEQLEGGAVYWDGSEAQVANPYVHHAIVSSCPEHVWSSLPDTQEGCYIMPGECEPLDGFTAGTPYGGLPEHVAGRFGGDDCSAGGSGDACRRLFIVQFHFENFDLAPGVSGGFAMRYYVQREAPQHELGHLAVNVPFNGINIPAESKATANGECPSVCTKNMLPEDGIDIVRIVLHAHEKATKIILRHIRNGMELPVLAEDHHYDFNQPALISSRRRLLPGDRLVLSCDYGKAMPI